MNATNRPSMERRVVITGMGAVTPLGNNVPAMWEACRRGVSGIGPITLFDASALASRIAGEVRGFDAAEVLGRKEARRTTRVIHLAVAAAREAVTTSRLDVAADGDEVGVLIASGIGGLDAIEEATRALDRSGPRRVSPFAAATALADMPAGMVAIDLQARGPNMAIVSACASGAHAVGEAAAWVRRGDAVAVIAGGVEAAITSTGMAMFAAARALSTRNDDPQGASRPFARDRDGFVASEGAAVVVVEDRDHALARGAEILAEVVGYGATADAYHMTAPQPDGDGAQRAIRRCLRSGSLEAADVDYVNAHGTGTPLNDVTETLALKAVLGERAYDIPISSTKSMSGHLLGAAGAVEVIVTVMAMRDSFLPPTINLHDPDPECDLDCVPLVGRAADIRVALSTSFGFGGHNACLALRRPDRSQERSDRSRSSGERIPSAAAAESGHAADRARILR